MKRLICLTAVIALCAGALAGCSGLRASNGTQPTAAAVFDPETTAVPEPVHGEEDQSLAVGNNPTLPPVETIPPEEVKLPSSEDEAEYFSVEDLLEGNGGPNIEFEGNQPTEGDAQHQSGSISVIDPGTVQFSALTDTTLGFTFNYPTRWENLPGVFTVCFREVVDSGDFPARVAVSAKKLVHTAEGNTISSQLTSYMRTIYQMYDPATFQAGTANEADMFLGRTAMSNTYLAYYGDIEIKGFIIGTAVEKTIYVFHFCASYDDYTALERVMRYMMNSVELVSR